MLGVRNQSLLLCSRWLNCFAHAINCGSIDTDGRAPVHAQSFVDLLLHMAEVLLCDPRRLCVDPRFAQPILGIEVCVCDPRIIAQKFGSEVCTGKSLNGPSQ